MHNVLTNVPAASQSGPCCVFLLKSILHLVGIYLDKKLPKFRNFVLNKSIQI